MRALRFPRRAHLRASAQFQAVFGGGTRFSGPLFRLQVLPASEAGSKARLGMTVSKRVDKRAVSRNRIRRQIREVFRLERHALPPGDYVFQAKPEARQVDNPGLRQALLKLLARAAMTLKPPVATGTMPPAASAADSAIKAAIESPIEAATAPPIEPPTVS
jgi:ribonuclease P protein component